jgi:hypothetical protein
MLENTIKVVKDWERSLDRKQRVYIEVKHVNQFGDKGEVIKLTKGGLRIKFHNRYLGRGL